MHLSVKLYRIDLSCLISNGRKGGIFARPDHFKPLRNPLSTIPMAHPNRAPIGNAPKKTRIFSDGQFCLAIFLMIGCDHLSAKMLRDQLHPVADSENRQTQIPDSLIRTIGILSIDRRRATRENDPFGAACLNIFERFAIRDNLGVDAALAELPGNELRVLRAKIKDKNGNVFHKKPLGGGRDIVVNRIIQKYSLELCGC